MGKMDTDKKLELVHTIRMQNQQDRELIRHREHLLYASSPLPARGEIYGLESAALPLHEKSQPSGGCTEATDSKILGGFRIRLVLAVLLLAAFIVCDRTRYSYQGESSDTVFERMQESIEIPTFL